MRQIAAIFALALCVSLLTGCVYDPYTGSWQPCCSYYGYPYPYPYGYRYPPPYYAPYGYRPGPYGAPPPAQPGAYPSQSPEQPGGYPSPSAGQPGAYPGQSPPGPGAQASPARGGALGQRLEAANATHDGRLTRDQAAAGMPLVAENFAAIAVEPLQSDQRSIR